MACLVYVAYLILCASRTHRCSINTCHDCVDNKVESPLSFIFIRSQNVTACFELYYVICRWKLHLYYSVQVLTKKT